MGLLEAARLSCKEYIYIDLPRTQSPQGTRAKSLGTFLVNANALPKIFARFVIRSQASAAEKENKDAPGYEVGYWLLLKVKTLLVSFHRMEMGTLVCGHST